MINYILTCLDTTKFKVYSDLEGHEAPNGGTIPTEHCITTLKPDITITDNKAKTFNIFELTVPMEPNIKARHKEKSDKYAHFLSDIKTLKPTLNCFEVGARGYLSPQNHVTLKTLHEYCKPGTKLKRFKENISLLALYSSYDLFNRRKETLWIKPGYLSPPLVDV